MSRITPCLLFSSQAEEAARFYVSVFGDGAIDSVAYYPESLSSAAGKVMLVEFTLFGQVYQALNGPDVTFNEGVSLSVACRDQVELDRWFDALTADGGAPGPCGWLKDRFGLSWQLVPQALMAMHESDDKVAVGRMMQAMMAMQKLDIAALESTFKGETA